MFARVAGVRLLRTERTKCYDVKNKKIPLIESNLVDIRIIRVCSQCIDNEIAELIRLIESLFIWNAVARNVAEHSLFQLSEHFIKKKKKIGSIFQTVHNIRYYSLSYLIMIDS